MMTAPLMEGVASAAQLWPPLKDAEPDAKSPRRERKRRNFPEVCSDKGRDNRT